MSIQVNSDAAMFDWMKIKQLQMKVMSTAAIEIRLLSAFHRSVNSVITAALHSGASNAYHGSTLIMLTSNLRLLMSLTWFVWRAGNRATRIARPSATSAAATVIIKKTKTCTL